MMSAVSSVWMYLLVTEPLACPTSAAMVTSVKPRSLAMLAKLWRKTWGVTSESGESLNSCFQWLGKLPNALSSPCPGKTYVPRPSVRRRSRYSTAGNPIGRMESPSLLSSSRRQLCLGVGLRPFQADHFAAPAAGQRKLANDVHG